MTYQSYSPVSVDILSKVLPPLDTTRQGQFTEMSGKNEFSLLTITAVVHHYLENRWIIVGPSRVGIYHDTDANSFRIVARKIDEHEVVANCFINESFSYDESTPSFHQWRDATKVYGIKFGSPDDGPLFAETIRRIVHTFEQVHRLIEANSLEQQQTPTGQRPDRLTIQVNSTPAANYISSPSGGTTVYVVDPMPNLPIGRPLLKPVPPPPPLPQNGWKTSNTNGGTNGINGKPAIQPKPVGASFLNEMELTLARRRAKIEAQDVPASEDATSKEHSRNGSSEFIAVSTFPSQSSNGPLPSLTNITSSSAFETNNPSSQVIERLKREILSEIREELSHFKSDLIQAIKEQLNSSQRQ